MRSIYTILQSVSESLPKQEQSTWCQSVSRTLKSRRVDGWGPHFCAQNCEAHRSLHQQCPRGSRRLAWRVKNWYALVNGVMNGTCSNTTKKTSPWVGGKGKKKQTNIACKICEGRGMRKDGFTLECKRDTSKVETPGTSMLAWIQSCSGRLHSENRRRASRSRTCPLMHLLKPKCQEKGLQKLLCTSDVLQMGALILYPPSFKPPGPPSHWYRC